MPTKARVTIYDTALDAMFAPGGDVWGWLINEVSRAHLAAALAEVPKRSGELARQHNVSVTPYRRGLRYSLGNYADYAAFVHYGTDGPIVANGTRTVQRRWGAYDPHERANRLLVLPPGGGYPHKIWTREVRGQAANPWIERAAEIALGKYGYRGHGFAG